MLKSIGTFKSELFSFSENHDLERETIAATEKWALFFLEKLKINGAEMTSSKLYYTSGGWRIDCILIGGMLFNLFINFDSSIKSDNSFWVLQPERAVGCLGFFSKQNPADIQQIIEVLDKIMHDEKSIQEIIWLTEEEFSKF